MSLFPEKIVRTRGSDGTSFTSEIYSLETWTNITFMGFFVVLFFAMAIVPILSAIMILLFCIDIDRDSKPYGLPLLGLIISAYILIDIANNWPVGKVIRFLNDGKITDYIVYINGATLIGNLILLISADMIFKESGKSTFVSFLLMVIITFFAYLFSMFVFDNIIKIF
jgi:hypothetical protein